MNKFLELFTQTKIKDPLILSMLHMDPVSSHITLQRISYLIGHNILGYRNLNTPGYDFYNEWSRLYCNLLKYYYQYHLKQRLYYLDEIDAADLERTHPIFRHKIAHKNKEFAKGIFVFGEEDSIIKLKKQQMEKNRVEIFQKAKIEENKDSKRDIDLMTDFLKNALDKFLPNLNTLWPLKDESPSPVMVLKIIKLLMKYSIFKKKHLTILMDLLLDKSITLRNLENLYNIELTHDNLIPNPEFNSINQFSQSPSTSSQNPDAKRMNPEVLKKWCCVLMKYRKLYSEIMILMLLYNMDDNMYDILKKNCDVDIKFDDFPKNSDEKFSEQDLKALIKLEKNVNFEDLGIFEEEQGENYMKVFFGYILGNPPNPASRFHPKLKIMAKMFMNFFANVNDINLIALKLMNKDVITLLKRDISLSREEENSDVYKAIISFVGHCEKCYLNEVKEFDELDFLSDFTEKLNLFHQTLNAKLNFYDYDKDEQDRCQKAMQDMLFQNNFLWILINIILKYSDDLKSQVILQKKILDLFELCLEKNIYFQNIMIQNKVLSLLEFKKEKLGNLGVGLVKLAFKKNPYLMVSNQNYLNLFFTYGKKCEISQKVFANEEDYYNSRAIFYDLLSHYLDEKYYSTAHAIPEYDLICLDNILNVEYTEKEFLNCSNIIEILANKNESGQKYKVK